MLLTYFLFFNKREFYGPALSHLVAFTVRGGIDSVRFELMNDGGMIDGMLCYNYCICLSLVLFFINYN